MTTIERPRERIRATPDDVTRRASRTWWIAAVVALLALAVGGVVGWTLRGDDTTPTGVLAGEGELTARQEQMLDLFDEYEQAWNDADGAAIVDMYTETGTFDSLGTVYRAGDGTLEAFVDRGWDVDVLRPVLVNGNEVLSFHTIDGSTTFMDTMTFTSIGEVLIIEHVITD